jgi:low affinity Fe/Cu permease
MGAADSGRVQFGVHVEKKHRSWFTRFSKTASRLAGASPAFMLAILLIVGWAVTGPMFGFSDTWQLVINTATTIITFLMVFLIQNTQNRDTAAMHVKLDEIVRALKGAHNAVIDLEQLDDKQLDEVRKSYERLAHRARIKVKNGGCDTDTPRIDQPEREEVFTKEMKPRRAQSKQVVERPR